MNTLTSLQGHRAETIITGKSYFDQLLAEMNYLLDANAGGIFWVHGWYFDLYEYATVMRFWGKETLPTEFGPAETTNDWTLYREGAGLKMGRSKTLFVDKLIALEAAGVDVRIIGNSAPLLFKSRAMLKATEGWEGTIDINGATHGVATNVHDRFYATFYNLLRLRNDLTAAWRVAFNGLNHPLGGAHSKMIIIGNGSYRKAFTGGIDLAADRNKSDNHDVAVWVEGRAATNAAKFFKDLWNEINSKQQVQLRFSATAVAGAAIEVPDAQHLTHLNTPLTTDITEIAPLPGTEPADKYVQMFRTLPRKNYYATRQTLLQPPRHQFQRRP
jgi:phosphatidylserine/phosphatidylglycerophosphate/cardiolipin synthase-like enzyme